MHQFAHRRASMVRVRVQMTVIVTGVGKATIVPNHHVSTNVKMADNVPAPMNVHVPKILRAPTVINVEMVTLGKTAQAFVPVGKIIFALEMGAVTMELMGLANARVMMVGLEENATSRVVVEAAAAAAEGHANVVVVCLSVDVGMQIPHQTVLHVVVAVAAVAAVVAAAAVAVAADANQSTTVIVAVLNAKEWGVQDAIHRIADMIKIKKFEVHVHVL